MVALWRGLGFYLPGKWGSHGEEMRLLARKFGFSYQKIVVPLFNVVISGRCQGESGGWVTTATSSGIENMWFNPPNACFSCQCSYLVELLRAMLREIRNSMHVITFPLNSPAVPEILCSQCLEKLESPSPRNYSVSNRSAPRNR